MPIWMDPHDIREMQIRNALSDAYNHANSVKLDGKNMTGSDFAECAQVLNQLGDDVVAQFFSVLKDAKETARQRQICWDDPLTRGPSCAPLHFIISIDSKVGWVEISGWHRCHLPQCPENH